MGDTTIAINWDYARDVLQKADGVLATVGLEADAAALSTSDSVAPETDFIVTAYVYNANKGDEVELILPKTGLTLAVGESAKKAVEEGGKRAAVFWKVHASGAGVYPIEAAGGGSKTKPHDVVVKSSSIFG